MHTKSILIIEDEDGIREGLGLSLKVGGYHVLVASNGREGLDILSQITPPQLIFLDLMMPVMNGWEFIENIKNNEKLSKIPIVVISAYSEQVQSIQSQGFLKKPIDLKLLYQTAKEWCEVI